MFNYPLLTTLADYPLLTTPSIYQFDHIRRNLVARRIQHAVRFFLNPSTVAIPRVLRMCLRAGYLRGDRALKTRSVIHEPWRVCLTIAEVRVEQVEG